MVAGTADSGGDESGVASITRLLAIVGRLQAKVVAFPGKAQICVAALPGMWTGKHLLRAWRLSPYQGVA